MVVFGFSHFFLFSLFSPFSKRFYIFSPRENTFKKGEKREKGKKAHQYSQRRRMKRLLVNGYWLLIDFNLSIDRIFIIVFQHVYFQSWTGQKQ